MKSKLAFLIALFMSISFTAFSQSTSKYAEVLSLHYEDYQIQNFDVNSALSVLKNTSKFHEMEFPNTTGGKWVFDLTPSHILSENFRFTKMENGKEIQEKNISVFPYRGYIKGDPNSMVTLTIADGFFQGTVRENGIEYSFQHLSSYVKTASPNEILVYENSKCLDTEERGCKLLDAKLTKEKAVDEEPYKSIQACRGVKMAIADDFLMYEEHGTNVLAHNVARVNDLQTNYVNSFNDEVEFTIEEIWVAITQNDDPWTSSTDSEVFLTDFTNWAQNGFNVEYNIGTIWTDRDFDGGAVGVAWLNSMCTTNRQNAIQDWTLSSGLLRTAYSHEIGHNFNATHDSGPGLIMSPVVNNTITWSNASIDDVNNTLSGITCLGGCQGFFSSPIADFSHDLNSTCAPVTVNFSDQSSGDIVSWIWLFPGGTPDHSTDPNPSVTYNTNGVYDVTLAVATDGGSDEITSFGEIVLTDIQIVDFSSLVIENTVFLTNNSTPISANFLWDFGDGNTSNDVSPQHTYDQDGLYQITLTLLSSCGDISFDQWVEIATNPIADFFTNSTFDCVPFTVEFINNSSDNVIDYFWEFEGGTPATSTDENPVVVYNTAGVFDVSLTVTNTIGSDQLQLFDYIAVDPLPQAGFTESTDMFTVNFSNTSVDALSVLWDFGDSNSSSMLNPTHTYAANGEYTVIITATNNCGTDTYSQTITINNGPSSAINYDTNIGCTDLTVNFDGSASSSASSYEWIFEGGNPSSSTMTNPIVEYSDLGTYDVTLIVSDGSTNDTLEMQDLIVVNTAPVADANISIDTMTMYGTVITDGTYNTIYDWDFGDGNTGTGDTVLHTYVDEEIYEVVVKAENECGVSFDTSYMNLYSIPNAGYTFSGTEGCVPFTVVFTDTSTIAVTEWAWSFPGGTPSSSTMQNPTVEYMTQGAYDVGLIVINPAGTDTLNTMSLVLVDDVPDLAFFAVNNLTTVNFTNQTTNATTYVWDFGDGNSSTLENPEHTYDEEGMYTVMLTATNACGTVSLTQEITVNQLPSAGFLTDTEEGCIPFDVQFTDASSINATEWEWIFEGGIPASSTDPSPLVTYASSGDFDVQLIVHAAAGSDTLRLEQFIFADDVPTTLFTFEWTSEFDIVFTNTTMNATSYLWDFGDGNSSIDVNPSHTYDEPGDYTITLSATNDCGTVVWQEDVTILASSIIEFQSIEEFEILPNPNSGDFKLYLELNAEEQFEISIVNILGQKLLKKEVQLRAGENIVEIQANAFSDGTYFLLLSAKDKKAIKKFIVNK